MHSFLFLSYALVGRILPRNAISRHTKKSTVVQYIQQGYPYDKCRKLFAVHCSNTINANAAANAGSCLPFIVMTLLFKHGWLSFDLVVLVCALTLCRISGVFFGFALEREYTVCRGRNLVLGASNRAQHSTLLPLQKCSSALLAPCASVSKHATPMSQLTELGGLDSVKMRSVLLRRGECESVCTQN